jgi:hypothetical protein
VSEGGWCPTSRDIPGKNGKFLRGYNFFSIFIGVIAGIAQLVERHLAKLNVAGSNPVSRSRSPERAAPVPFRGIESFLTKSLRPPRPTRRRGFIFSFRWRRTQVVRERSAKPLCGGSNPPGASSMRKAVPAGVAKLVDAQDLKSCSPRGECRFDSGSRHADVLFGLLAQLVRALP